MVYSKEYWRKNRDFDLYNEGDIIISDDDHWIKDSYRWLFFYGKILKNNKLNRTIYKNYEEREDYLIIK